MYNLLKQRQIIEKNLQAPHSHPHQLFRVSQRRCHFLQVLFPHSFLHLLNINLTTFLQRFAYRPIDVKPSHAPRRRKVIPPSPMPNLSSLNQST